MMEWEWIHRTEAFLQQSFAESRWLADKSDARSYRLEHSYRVANIGWQLARAEGFNETDMVIACLLHDISYCEEFGEDGWMRHGVRSAQLSRPFLQELGLEETRIREICCGIAIHVDGGLRYPGEITPFALSVGDADNIDRFDVSRLHETLCREEFLQMPLGQKTKTAEERLGRLRALLSERMATESAQKLWEARLSFSIDFYTRLLVQLKWSEHIVKP